MEFYELFKKVKGFSPYPWQHRFYQSIIDGKIPTYLDIPTGLGKTSIMLIWIIAKAKSLQNTKIRIPTRLVYMVDRRVIVDQATEEVNDIIEKTKNIPELKDALKNFKVSKMRGGGGMSDSREWLSQPENPAIIIGTIDMIGSRLFFSGYGVNHKSRSFHAGLLGQDSLIVLDESHLSPAMVRALKDIRNVQSKKLEFFPPKILFMSATQSNIDSTDKILKLNAEDLKDEEIEKRYNSKKNISIINVKDRVEATIEYSKKIQGRILIYQKKPRDVEKIFKKLETNKQKAIMLTGTLRGYERDSLVENEVWKAFVSKDHNKDESKFLVSTSAGEVGVDLDADHMICDITTFDSFVQRLGRVNRSGGRDSKVFVLYSDDDFKKSKILEQLEKTRDMLKNLAADKGYNASPANLAKIDPKKIYKAFSPPPETQPLTTDILEMWALTSIAQYTSRPNVSYWLRGKDDINPSETQIAWRDDVEYLARVEPERIQDLLELYRILPHETAREHSNTVYELLKNLTDKIAMAIIIKSNGKCLVEKIQDIEEDDIKFSTIILPCRVGGLDSNGFVTNTGRKVSDVADDKTYQKRVRIIVVHHADGSARVIKNISGAKIDDDLTEWQKKNSGMHILERIPISDPEDEGESCEIQYWIKKPELQIAKSNKEQTLQEHHEKTEKVCKKILKTLSLPEPIKEAIMLATRFHDIGKSRNYWQSCMHVSEDKRPLAKTNFKTVPLNMYGFRHEFASVIDCMDHKKIPEHNEIDLILHLIAAHHGWARPCFLPEVLNHEGGPQNNISERGKDVFVDVMRRYHKLQKRFGIWGLAYLEGLMRGSDWQASDLSGEST